MQNKPLKFIIFYLFSLIFFSACSADKKYDKKKAINLLTNNQEIVFSHKKVQLAKSINKQSFLNNDANNLGHLTKNYQVKQQNILGFLPKQFYYFDKQTIYQKFYLQNTNQTFIFEPQIHNNNLFVFTASGHLQKYQIISTEKVLSFKLLWQKSVSTKIAQHNYRLLKLSWCQEMLFLIDGSNKITALSVYNGNLLWQKELSAMLSSAPICTADAVFVSSGNNKTFSLQKNNGNINWIHQGLIANTAILNSPNLAFWHDNLLVAYASGDVYLLKQKTAEVLWQNNVNLYQNTFHQDYLNDINANLIIDDNVLFVLGNGGLLKSLNLADGKELWRLENYGLANFWLTGDNLFFINKQNQLIALDKKNAYINWQSQLPYLAKTNKLSSKIIYNGLVVAGEKILITSQQGELFIVSASNGNIETQINLGAKIFHQPLVLDDKIYLHLLHKLTSQLIVLQ
jgi:outer membrane protein assembly factor BamB